MLDLSSFIEESQKNKINKKEEKDEIILELKLNNSNPYISTKKLYLNKNTGIPTKMEIEDNNKNTKIHILYTEVKINNLY